MDIIIDNTESNKYQFNNYFNLGIVIIIIIIIFLIYKYTILENNKLILSKKNTNYNYVYDEYNIPNNIINLNTNKPSSYIFEIFTKDKYKNIYNHSIQVQKYFGINKTVYGIKKRNNSFSFEYYYYYPSENKLHNIDYILKFLNKKKENDFKRYYLISYEITEDNTNLNDINELNIYHTIDNCIHNSNINYHNSEICRKCLKCYNNTWNIKTNELVKKNTYKFFLRKISTNDEIIEYTKNIINKNIDYNEILYPYINTFTNSICVTEKPTSIGFYHSGIPLDNLIIFLERTQFDKKITEEIKKNKNNLNYLLFDIGFDINVNEKNEIIYTKLSIYGIL
jgi:hypothetical protein